MKIFIVVITLISILLLSSCEKEPSQPDESDTETDTVTVAERRTNTELEPETLPEETYIDTEPYEEETVSPNPHRVYRELSGCYEMGEFTKISGRLILRYIGEEKVDAWSEEIEEIRKNDYTNDQGNIYDFVKYFNIPRDIFEEYCQIPNSLDYSEEMVNDIYTLDEMEIKIKNMSPIAILHNNVIYPADWFANNPAEKYVEVGIDPDEVIEKLSWYIEYKLYYPNEYDDGHGYYNHYVREYKRYCELVGRPAKDYDTAPTIEVIPTY